MAQNRKKLNSTIVLSESDDSDDVVILDSTEPVICLGSDPISPTSSPEPIKSVIEKVFKKMAEDGEILSSPDVEEGVEITLHADTGISSDEDLLSNSPTESSSKKSKEEESKSKRDEEKLKENQRKLPTQKEVGPVVETEEDFEVDHLEIVAPLQGKSKQTKSKTKEKSSPNKSRDGGRTSGKVSPSIDSSSNRKRTHDNETPRSSDDNDDRKRSGKSKQGGTDADDLRKQLMMKLGRESSSTNSSKSNRDERSSNRDNRESIRENRDSRQKEGRIRDRDLSREDRHASSDHRKQGKDTSSVISSSSSRNSKDTKQQAHDESKKGASDRKKDKKREREDRERDRSNKKKKKRKHKESLGEGSDAKRDTTPLKDEVKDRSHEPKKSKSRDPSYDDISSPEQKKSPTMQLQQQEEVSSDSEPPTPPSSVEMTPSRSPTPERSPTPVRKRTFYPGIEGCRSVEEFSWLNRIEEGTYGVVYRARDKRTDEVVALKRLKMEKEREGFPITSLREINTLLKAQHPNIVTVREIVVGDNMDKIYIVMDYVEHDLKALMETMKEPFLVGEVKTLMIQLLRGVQHMHDNWILHRDIKASNLLLSHKGILKIGDFGLAREYGSPLKKYTSIVVTLWYRAPELLLGTKEYSCPIDIWSVGCVFAELLTMKPLFPGKSEIDQINKIFRELGTPNDKIWPGPPSYSELPQVKKMNIAQHPYNSLRSRFGLSLTDYGFDLMNSLLTYDPSKRITAEDALQHQYFKESPGPVNPSMFPTWPAKSELGHKTKKNASPKAPQGGGQSNALMGDNEGGFHMGGTNKGSSAKGLGFNLKF